MLKAKRSGFLEPTLQRENLKKTFVTAIFFIINFKSNLGVRGFPDYLVNKVLAEVQLTSRRPTFEQKPLRVQSGLMHFATQYSASVPNVKSILMCKWHLIQNRPLLKETYREPSFISYSKGKSLKDILVEPANSWLPLCNENMRL